MGKGIRAISVKNSEYGKIEETGKKINTKAILGESGMGSLFCVFLCKHEICPQECLAELLLYVNIIQNPEHISH